MLDRTSLARDEAINAAMENAIDDSLRDGPWSDELVHQLGKHGLVIVEADKLDAMRTTLQMLASCTAPGDASGVMGLMANAARKALAKGD